MKKRVADLTDSLDQKNPLVKSMKTEKKERPLFRSLRHGQFLNDRKKYVDPNIVICHDENCTQFPEKCKAFPRYLGVCYVGKVVSDEKEKEEELAFAPFNLNEEGFPFIPDDILVIILDCFCTDFGYIKDNSLFVTVGFVCKKWKQIVEARAKIHRKREAHQIIYRDWVKKITEFKKLERGSSELSRRILLNVIIQDMESQKDSMSQPMNNDRLSFIVNLMVFAAAFMPSKTFKTIATFYLSTPELRLMIVKTTFGNMFPYPQTRVMAAKNLFNEPLIRLGIKNWTDIYTVTRENPVFPYELAEIAIKYNDWPSKNSILNQMLRIFVDNNHSEGINLFYTDPLKRFDFFKKRLYRSTESTIWKHILNRRSTRGLPIQFISWNWHEFTSTLQEALVAKCSYHNIADLIRDKILVSSIDFLMGSISQNKIQAILFQNMSEEEKRQIHPNYERFFE